MKLSTTEKHLKELIFFKEKKTNSTDRLYNIYIRRCYFPTSKILNYFSIHVRWVSHFFPIIWSSLIKTMQPWTSFFFLLHIILYFFVHANCLFWGMGWVSCSAILWQVHQYDPRAAVCRAHDYYQLLKMHILRNVPMTWSPGHDQFT